MMIRFKQLAWSAKCVVQSAIAATALGSTAFGDNSRVTAKSYVQKDLIAQWDGIDNSGTGKHDSTATAWIDLVGGRQFSLYNTVWQGGTTLHFNGTNAYGFLSGADTEATFGVVASLGVFETALKVPKVFSKTILKSVANVAFNVPGGKNAIEFQFRNPSTKTYQVSYDIPTTVAAVYTSSADADFSVYGDGKLLQIGTADSVGGNAGGGTLLGCRNSGTGTTRERFFGGDIWAIRLYSRALSQEELKINAALDQVRFFGATADINTLLPTGWGVGDDGVLCHLYANGATLEVGQVFDDFDVEFAPDATVALSSAPTVESAALTVTGKKITVKGAVTFLLPQDVAPGTYIIAHADEIVLAAGASVAASHQNSGYLCTPSVSGKDITVEVAYDTSLPPTAEWIGGSTGRPDDPDSWICRRSNGEVIENGLPTAEMQVVLPDGCSANFPVGAAFSALEVVLPATLGADCDWSGIAAPLVGKLDLKGHRLTVSQLVSTTAVEITDSNNYALLEWIASQADRKQYIDTGVVPKTPFVGEFDLEKLDKEYDVGVMGYRSTDSVVGDNNFFPLAYYGGWRFSIGPRMLDGHGVVRTGRLRLRSTFMDGSQELRDLDAGDVLWTAKGTPHSYEDGSLFLFGYSKAGVLGDPMQMRLFSCKLDDGQGTVFRHFVPARRLSDGAVGLLDLAHLNTANEFYGNAGSGEFVSGPVTNALFHSGATGGELHVVVAAGQATENVSVVLTGSVPLVKEGAGTLTWSGEANTASVSLGVSNGVFSAVQGLALTVLDVAADATFSTATASIPVESLVGGGTVTGAGFAFDGTGARWTMEADDTGWTKKIVLAEVNASVLTALRMINVIYAGENPATLEICPALGLTTETLPAFAVCAPDGKLIDSELKIRDGQLVLEIALRVFEATWNGTAGDGNLANPENWSCTNGLGQAMTGVPDGHTTVNFRGPVLPNIPAGTPPFAAKCVVLSGAMAADRDWSALPATIPVSGKIDLKGNKLTVADLPATWDVEITNSTGTSYQLLESIASQADRKQYIDTGVVPKTPMVCEFDLEKLDTVEDTGVIGYRNTSGRVNDNNFFPLSYYKGWSYSTGGVLTPSVVRTGRLRFRSTFLDGFQELRDLDKGDVIRTSTDKPHSYESGSLFLFGYSKNGVLGDAIQMRLYSCRISDGQGNVFRDFVPAKRLSDGKVGLLDLAHLGTANEFYVNKGTGSFTAGAVTGFIFTRPGSAEQVAPGELHLNVAQGATVENTSVTLSGSLKFVKEGPGKLTMSKKSQSYAGGTEILNGQIATPCSVDGMMATTGSKASDLYLGAAGSTITVRQNGELNISGNYNYDTYHVVLDGGMLRNTSGNGGASLQEENPSGVTGLGWLTLTADSTIALRSCILASGKNDTPVDLGGQTLTIDASVGSKYVYWKKNICNGTLFLKGYTQDTLSLFYVSSAVDASTVTLIDGMGLVMNNAMTVSNYTARLSWDNTSCTGSAALNVLGTFKPETSYFYGCTLQDGATLDLSAQTGAWGLTSGVTKYGSRAVKFASDAQTIYIDLGKRHFEQDELIVSWDANTRPPDTLRFKSAGGRGIGFIRRTDGIHVVKGMMIIFY